MEFLVLGPVEAHRSSRRIRIDGQKPLVVLAMLIAAGGRALSVDQLTIGLWGDEAPRTAHKALHTYISSLRKALEPDRAGDSPQVLLTTATGYRLALEGASIDAEIFRDLVQRGRRHLAEGQHAEAESALSDGLGLWRGPAYAQALDAEPVHHEAVALEELRLAANEDLLEARLELGDEAKVAVAAERMTLEHPLRERSWACLMLARYRMGCQAEALGAYRRLRTVLGEELGIEPSSELQALEEAILLHDPAVGRQRHDGSISGGHLDLPRFLAPRPETPFVGRREEVGTLLAAWSDASAGAHRLVAVLGEAGIGKTALVSHAARQLHDLGANVVAGRCREDGQVPYLPVIEVIRQVLTEPDADRLLGSLRQLATPLNRLVPDLVSDGPALRAEPGTERHLLHEAVAQLLRATSRERPLVVILDDVQWADAGTLDLIRHVAGHPEPARVLVLMTARPGSATEDRLDDLLDDLARFDGAERLPLEGLTLDESTMMLASITDGRLPEVAASVVHTHTGGNPFFLEELAGHMGRVGALDDRDLLRSPADVENLGVPPMVQRAVGRRFAAVPHRGRSLLEMAAVIGTSFGLDILSAATGIDSLTVVDLLYEARSRGMVVEIPGESGRFAFRHALIRQSVYEAQTPVRLVEAHRRIAHALDALASRPSEAARHWLAAGELTPAVRALVAATEEAESLLAFEVALGHVEELLAVWDEVPAPNRPTGIDEAGLLGRAARLCAAVGRYGEAVEYGRRAIRQLEEAPARKGSGLADLAHYLWKAGHGREALSAAEQAIGLFPSAVMSEERAGALASLAHLHMVAGRYADARLWGERALRAAREVGAGVLEANVLCTVGTAAGLDGDVEEGISQLDDARRISEEQGAIDEQARAYNNLGVVLFHTGRIAEAGEMMVAAADLAFRYGPGQGGWFFRANAASAFYNSGRWEVAWSLLEEAPLGVLEGTAAFMVAEKRAQSLIGWGRFSEAKGLAKQLHDVVDGQPELLSIAHDLEARIARLENRMEDAVASSEQALAALDGLDDWRLRTLVLSTAVEVHAESAAASDEARRRRIAALVGELRIAVDRAPLALSRARLAQAEAAASRSYGTPDPDLWAAAAALWDEGPNPHAAAWCRYEQAVDLAHLGQRKDAAQMLADAGVVAERLGAVPLERRIADTFESLGS